jgi:imidazolonepropionase-like amidohydrolase
MFDRAAGRTHGRDMTARATEIRRVLLLAALPLLGCGGPPADVPPPTVIRDVRVFDGTGVIPAATVVLDNRRIAQVRRPGEPVEIPVGALVVDGSGKTLLPGFIDAHTHTTSRGRLKNALAFGVTTQLDMFTDLALLRAMKEEQASGAGADRPDLFSAGTLVTAPGGHPTQYGVPIPTLADAAQAQSFVDARLAEGSDYIKIVIEDGTAFGMTVPTLGPAAVRAVVEAAHARGRLAIVHVGTARAAREAIDAGADGLAHVFADRLPEADFGRFAADRGAFVVPTLTVIENTTSTRHPTAIMEDPVLGPRLSPSDEANLTVALPIGAGALVSMTNAFEAVRLLTEAGATVLAGTDAPNPGTVPGASLHRELELLVRAGLSPVDALRGATAAAAAAFGLTDRGEIRPGLRADVVLVQGDPTTDILQTRDVVGIWKEGRRYKIELYLEEVARARAAVQVEPGGPPPPGAESGVISDFDEPGEIGEAPRTRFGAGWEASTDATAGGRSTVTLTVARGGADGSAGALAISGDVATGAAVPFAGAMFRPGETPAAPVNLSAFEALAFTVRGDGGSYRVLVYDARSGGSAASQTFEAGPEWTDVEIRFADHDMDGRAVRGVLFAAVGAPRAFAFTIDAVRLR